MNNVKPTPEIIARFIERFNPPAAWHGRYICSPETVAESIMMWIMSRPLAYVEEIVWSRVMQDRLYFEMGEHYLKPYRDKNKLTNRRYALVGKEFTRDIMDFMTREMGWQRASEEEKKSTD